ncbi:hypothetical protein [Phaeobacter porticola]|uniref:Uncharacterized protein n=1 Tax=Phaeobacter porticola TaxID=1844006 RepID=A0A1L3I578_9RHOB|nr:hypothetical protein [Phaeobacter porticola]APG47310.1 hypothetical protein PhaeoP97_01899 [Phaeobacter porticola]
MKFNSRANLNWLWIKSFFSSIGRGLEIMLGLLATATVVCFILAPKYFVMNFQKSFSETAFDNSSCKSHLSLRRTLQVGWAEVDFESYNSVCGSYKIAWELIRAGNTMLSSGGKEIRKDGADYAAIGLKTLSLTVPYVEVAIDEYVAFSDTERSIYDSIGESENCDFESVNFDGRYGIAILCD